MDAISLEDGRAQKELHGTVLSEEEPTTGNRRAASMKFSATERAWISETLHPAAAANRNLDTEFVNAVGHNFISLDKHACHKSGRQQGSERTPWSGS